MEKEQWTLIDKIIDLNNEKMTNHPPSPDAINSL